MPKKNRAARPRPPKPGELLRPSRWDVTDADRALFRQHLRSFVPPGAFDVHAHFYPMDCLGPGVWDDADDDIGVATYRRSMRAWMGDRCPRDGLFFAMPTVPAKGYPMGWPNNFVWRELWRHPASRRLLLARPQDDPAAVESEVDRNDAITAGLKVSHTFLDRPDADQAQIDEYVPRWMWELADRRGLVIVIHLVRPLALADAGNQRSLRKHCARFKNVRVILAHAGSGFCGRHTVDGVASLAGLDSVFFDTSAICESDALIAILNQFGPTRLMFGSDFPVAAMRGRAVSIGDGFARLMAQSLDWSKASTAPPTLIGIESLLAVKRAALLARLKDRDVEAIFGANARTLLGIR